MQFLKPEIFLYLWLVPAVLVLYWASRKIWQKRLGRLIQEKALLAKLLDGYRSSEWLTRSVLMALVVLCFVLALARPQWGDEKRSIQRKGVDIIFLVDTSLSMLAEDIKPNRITKAKFEIETFIRNLRGDRAGMVTFAGSGFLQTPLTLDHAAFLLFLDAVQVGFLPDPGTSLAQAIHLALRAFPQKELKYKALILFTDGEDFDGGIENAIAEVKEAGVRIYAIGLGTTEGEPIPLKNEKGERTGFKKDRSGQMVLTKLNPALLERVAKETGGLYLPGTPGEKEVDLVLKHLRGWGEQQFSEKTVVEKEDQFQTFLVFALILLFAEMLVRRRSRKGAALLGCLFAFFFLTGFFETQQTTVKKGNDHFQGKQYQSAIESYRKVQLKNPDSPEVLYDLGTALYKVDSFQEAAQDLETAGKTQDPKLKAQTLYNYGNAQYRLGNFEKAIESYKQALDINPDDKDAKYNLEFLQKKKGSFEKKDQERKKENQKKDQQQQQQNPQQNQQDQQGQGQKDQQSQGQGQKDQQNQGQGQKDQQDQGQGEKQDQKDQQKQDQKDQSQGQKDQQKQDQNQQQQQEQQAQQSQQQKEDQQKQKDQQQQQQEEKEKQEQQKKEEEQRQKEQEQKEKEEQRKREQQQQEQQQQEQPQQGQEQENAQEQPKPAEQKENAQPKRPLQGQMSKENALNILDALKESEKELQDLRRPPVNKNPPQVDKDW